MDELTSEYKDGNLLYPQYHWLHKIDLKKLKKSYQALTLNDETVSYSVPKDSLSREVWSKIQQIESSSAAALFCFSMNSWPYFGRIGFLKQSELKEILTQLQYEKNSSSYWGFSNDEQ